MTLPTAKLPSFRPSNKTRPAIGSDSLQLLADLGIYIPRLDTPQYRISRR